MSAAEVDQDAFYVLTALLLTPQRYPGVLGDDFPDACAALGLEPHPDGYGLVFGQDAGGSRWTLAVTDTALVSCAIAAWDCGLPYELAPPEKVVVAELPGWPLQLAVSAPGLPAPHDPPGEEPVLAPPDTAVWGSVQRRLGADEVARRWTEVRAEVGDDTFGASHAGVRRALAEAEGYVRSAPPPGRVRRAFAADGVPTLRADGPGWSMVARTDDIAFLLLDDEPRAILPVGRGPALPALLAGLEGLVAPGG